MEGENLNAWWDKVPKLAQLAGGVSIVLFALGFLVVNVFLGRYGVQEYDLIRAQYLVAGVLYVLFLLDLWFSAGRHAISIVKDQQEFVENNLDEIETPSGKYSLASAFLLTQLAFVITVGIALYGALFFTPVSEERYRFVAAVMLAGLIRLAALKDFEVKRKHTKVRLWLICLLHAVVFIGFWFIASTGERWLMWISIVSVMTVAYWASRPMTTDQRKGVSAAVISGVILGAVFFGGAIYPHITPALGGGKPTAIDLILEQELPTDVYGLFHLDTAGYAKGLELVAETKDDLILLRVEKDGLRRTAIRIPRKSVQAVIFKTGE